MKTAGLIKVAKSGNDDPAPALAFLPDWLTLPEGHLTRVLSTAADNTRVDDKFLWRQRSFRDCLSEAQIWFFQDLRGPSRQALEYPESRFFDSRETSAMPQVVS